MEETIIKFLLKLANEEELKLPEKFIYDLKQKESFDSLLQGALNNKYENKKNVLIFLRSYEILTNQIKVDATVDSVKNLYFYMNQDTIKKENLCYRDFDFATKYKDIILKHPLSNSIKSYMNYDFKYDIDFFKKEKLQEKLTDLIFWRIAKLYEISPFAENNLWFTIIYAVKLIQNITINTPNLENVLEINFKEMLFFSSYEDIRAGIERKYDLLDSFINKLM